jgi:hypothetical protein
MYSTQNNLSFDRLKRENENWEHWLNVLTTETSKQVNRIEQSSDNYETTEDSTLLEKRIETLEEESRLFVQNLIWQVNTLRVEIIHHHNKKNLSIPSWYHNIIDCR